MIDQTVVDELMAIGLIAERDAHTHEQVKTAVYDAVLAAMLEHPWVKSWTASSRQKLSDNFGLAATLTAAILKLRIP